MVELSAEEFKERQADADKFLEDLTEWFRFEFYQRIINRSHGDMESLVHFEDGKPMYTKVTGSHTIKPKSRAKLPSRVD